MSRLQNTSEMPVTIHQLYKTTVQTPALNLNQIVKTLVNSIVKNLVNQRVLQMIVMRV